MTKRPHSERKLINQVRMSKYVIIYGSGMVGELTCKRLQAHGLGQKIVSFAVSEGQKDALLDSLLCGFPIQKIDKLVEYRKTAIIIIATLPNVQAEIEANLLRLQFENILFVSPKLYRNFFQNYIPDFKRQHEIQLISNVGNKILFMASDNNRTSGAFLCLVELCDQLQKNGVAVLVILPQFGQGAALLEDKRIPYTYIAAQDWGYEIAKDHNFVEKCKFFIGMLGNYKAEKELLSLMKAYAVDLVHCNTTYTYIGALAAKRCGIPFVWHLRECMEDQGYRIFMPVRGWNLIRQADKVIAVSGYIKSLIPFANKEFASVVYDTVEIEEQACVERDIFQKETIRMIMVGGITRYKRQEELIEACAILNRRNMQDFHLIIVGRGEADYVNKLRHRVYEYDLEKFITFYGMSNCVSQLYTQSDIAFMCSVAEPYGRVTVEAQMYGCLVIGSNSGATPELIQDGKTGYLYESGNPEALAEKIITAIRNPELSRKIARTGQKYALNTYTKESNFCEIMDIYEEVLKKSGRA